MVMNQAPKLIVIDRTLAHLNFCLLLRFNMRPDIQSYHLGGMGCGTGVVGINLIRDLLKV